MSLPRLDALLERDGVDLRQRTTLLESVRRQLDNRFPAANFVRFTTCYFHPASSNRRAVI